MKDVVVALSGPPLRLTLASFAEHALRAEIERLKQAQNKGRPFPKCDGELRAGGQSGRDAAPLTVDGRDAAVELGQGAGEELASTTPRPSRDAALGVPGHPVGDSRIFSLKRVSVGA